MKAFFLLKPYHLFIIALFSCVSLKAIDVVTLNSGEELNVILLKLEKSNIEYKLSSDPLGETFKMRASKIQKIKLDNGDEWHYNKLIVKQLEYNYPLIEKIGRKRFAVDGLEVSYQTYLSTLEKHYPNVYLEYEKGKSYTKMGTWFLGLSPLLIGGGYFVMDNVREKSWGSWIGGPLLGVAGVSSCVIGSAMALSSIPLLLNGFNKKASVYKMYQKERQHCIYDHSLEIVPFVAPNAVGVAITF